MHTYCKVLASFEFNLQDSCKILNPHFSFVITWLQGATGRTENERIAQESNVGKFQVNLRNRLGFFPV